ncbi:MAG: 16S rRNA (cytosine(1402)-N(4))-methyltransferase RsmH [Bdellovibrionaceae bacterium]|nr:16S rRNA (cytosine(1402)-N(4))-methyltransferase RsmH [Bdellovibrio sp.]
MSEVHKPVLLNEVIESFADFKNRVDLTFFDGTYGRGGHFREILNTYHPHLAILTDQDSAAIEKARTDWQTAAAQNKVKILHQNFSMFAMENEVPLDMILLDLGVSSPQLDQPERGFSFNKDGPLDMRMNQNAKLTAAEIVNQYEADDLTEIFKTYGEIYTSGRVVRAIVNDRVEKPFQTTLQLAQMIERVDGWHKKGFHPATQYFMALRLVVNRELQVIEDAIPRLINQLLDGGRISVITFHSLEDRIIKNLFKDSELGFLVNKKVIVPTEEECKINPRARSAKLRIFQKGKMPEKPDKFAARRALRIMDDA